MAPPLMNEGQAPAGSKQMLEIDSNLNLILGQSVLTPSEGPSGLPTEGIQVRSCLWTRIQTVKEKSSSQNIAMFWKNVIRRVQYLLCRRKELT